MIHAEEPFSFKHEGITLAGTLTCPRSAEPHAGVVFITGSGPQDRDNTIAGFPMFRRLAAALAGRGIASLRCDDRGVGGSGASMRDATLEIFADDAVEAMHALGRRLAVPGLPIGFVGHSEGGAVALLSACRSNPAFVVMLAGPGAPVEANILAQSELIGFANGDSALRIDRETALLKRIFQVLRCGEAVDVLLPDFVDYAAHEIAGMPEAQRSALADVEAHARILFRQRMADMDTPWFRSFLEFQAAEILPKLDCPVLALFGGRDLQVPVDLNLEPMLEIASSGCPPLETEVFPEANHLFLPALGGSPAEYSKLRHEFVAGFVERIADWIIRISPE